jgi:glutamine synthetase
VQERQARQTVLLDHNVGTVEMETSCLIDMIQQRIIPSVNSTGVRPLSELQAATSGLRHAETCRAKGVLALPTRKAEAESQL